MANRKKKRKQEKRKLTFGKRLRKSVREGQCSSGKGSNPPGVNKKPV